MKSIFSLYHAKPHLASLVNISLFLSPIFLVEVIKVSAYHATRQPSTNTLRFPVSFPHSYVFQRGTVGPINTCLAAFCEYTTATLANWSFFYNVHNINCSSTVASTSVFNAKHAGCRFLFTTNIISYNEHSMNVCDFTCDI